MGAPPENKGAMLPVVHALVSPMGCSPEAKFFFTRLLYLYGPSQVFAGRVKDIARTFRVRDRVISRVLEELTKSRYLKRHEERARKGRPKRSYECIEPRSFSFAAESIAHESRVEVLLNDQEGRAKEVRLELSFSNRLLLAVLLCHSDYTGVVTGVGMTALAALTGMTRDRLKYQLRKLEAAGYLRPSVAGMTSSGLFGGAKGLYFINLRHPCFAGDGRSGTTISVTADAPRGKLPAELIIHLAKSLNFRSVDQQRMEAYAKVAVGLAPEWLPCEDEFVQFWPLFSGQLGTTAGRNFLQAKLNLYASYLLTNCWADLNDAAHLEPPAELLELIDRECFGFRRDKKLAEAPDLELQQALTRFLYRIALRIAQLLHRPLKDKGKGRYREGMTYVVWACERKGDEMTFKADAYDNEGLMPADYADVPPLARDGGTPAWEW